MRILVIGAGAVGGYFGGRLLEAGRDVTFLVRERRGAELAADGLVIRSPLGNLNVPAPPALTVPRETFDVVLLSCKAYDLESAMDGFAAAVGPTTAIVPLLNGMRHLDVLAARFGPARVLGGQCLISATLNDKREIVHLNDIAAFSFGEREGAQSERVMAIDQALEGARFGHRGSANIVLEMWEKWVFLATLAGCTCLMRASIGDIVAAPGGLELLETVFGECTAAAEGAGYGPRPEVRERARGMLTAAGSGLKASMLRDVEAGARTEADHVIGDLLGRGKFTMLRVAYTALKAYEAARARV